MTDKQLEIARKCIYACETGGQVYGKAKYDCYIGKNTNSSKEIACTIGAAGNYGATAKKLMLLILEKFPFVFKKNDTQNIENDLKESWDKYDPGINSNKAKCIQKIIGTKEGIQCQDELLNSQIIARSKKVSDMGVINIDAQIYATQIIHLGGYEAFKRVLKKTKKPYTLDNIYKALKTDQNDKSSDNQVGDRKYWSRHEKIYKWLKEKIPSTISSITTDKGGANKMTGEEMREAVGKCYDEIIGRNYYSQNLRDYCYTKYKNGLYYSDCSSSISYAYKRAGYGFGILNTAGMYYKLKTVHDITISGGQIQNVSKLRKGDCLMFKGSDPSRPLQIGHVEMVRAINGSTAASVIICGHGSGRPSKKNMRDYCAQRYNAGRGLVCVLRYIDDDGNVYGNDKKSSTTLPSTKRSYLQKGDSGSAVKTMQTMLIKCGYSCGKSGADGDFGTGTQTALKAFQKAYKLEVDGKYGSASKAKLEAVYKEKTKTTTSTTTKPSTNTSTSSSKSNTIVKAGQIHANNFAGAKITCDGERGTATKKAGIKVLQTAMNLDYNAKLKVDGAFGSASRKALKGHTVRKGESQYMVTALQILLMLKGYDPNGVESPGSFGSGCKAALKKYQKANGLTVDGIAGYNTFISLIS